MTVLSAWRRARTAACRLGLPGLVAAAVLVASLALAPGVTRAAPQPGNAASGARAGAAGLSAEVAAWLDRLQRAPIEHSYTGKVRVSAHGRTSTSRVEHVRDAHGVFLDRIETLGGPRRITYRQRDEVLTLWPDKRQAVREIRDPLLSFPDLPRGPVGRLAEFYAITVVGEGMVAEFAAVELDFQPRDTWRNSYRLWVEKNSGLPVRIEVRDAQGLLLEQSMFTALTLNSSADASAAAEVLRRQRDDLQGYKVKDSSLRRTQAAREGWRMARPVPGFSAVSCYRRLLDKAGGAVAMQWIFSDGLASVSLFLQPYDKNRHQQEVQLMQGATRVLTRRVANDWWLTAVGEVPLGTLQALADGLERAP